MGLFEPFPELLSERCLGSSTPSNYGPWCQGASVRAPSEVVELLPKNELGMRFLGRTSPE